MSKRILAYTLLCLIVVLLVGIAIKTSALAYNPDSWTLKLDNDRVLRELNGGYVVSCDGNYYVIYGRNVMDPGVIAYYDPNTDKWEIANNSAIQAPVGAVTVCNNKIYIYAGGTFRVYDPATQSLKLKASPPVPIREMYTMNNKIYVFAQVTWTYDPANDSWSEIESLWHLPSYSYFAGTVIDNKLYIVGTSGQNTSLMILDPQTGTWSQGAPVPHAVNGMSSCATSGYKAAKRLYLADPNAGLLWVYNPQTNIWSSGTSPPSNVTVQKLTCVDDVLYAFCVSNRPVNFLLEYRQIYVYLPQDYNPSATYPPPTPTPLPMLSPSISPVSTQTTNPSPTPPQTQTPPSTLTNSPTSTPLPSPTLTQQSPPVQSATLQPTEQPGRSPAATIEVTLAAVILLVAAIAKVLLKTKH